MTRTIYVVFPKEIYGTSWKYITSHKKYAFLCNYDNVQKKDIIVDPRYSSPMVVVDITSCTNRVQNGITLKDIYITMVNDKLIYQPSGLVNGSIIGSDFDIDKERTNNMKKRNIQIDKETARKWYNGNDNTLKELALQAFKEEELRESVIRTYQDLYDNAIMINGYYISNDSNIRETECSATKENYNIAISEKVAKSMLAMAMISQLMPYYGGAITDEEWKNDETKYTIFVSKSKLVYGVNYNNNVFLSFHTKEQRDNFLKYNKQLVKDYLMID